MFKADDRKTPDTESSLISRSLEALLNLCGFHMQTCSFFFFLLLPISSHRKMCILISSPPLPHIFISDAHHCMNIPTNLLLKFVQVKSYPLAW